MAKQIKFDAEARQKILAGVEKLSNAVTSTRRRREALERRHLDARSVRTQRHPRQEVRLAADHQGRRDRREGDRAARSVREHGRADGEGSRLEDERRRWRRNHHGDAARGVDLPRGTQEPHGGRQRDGPQGRHRQGHGRRRRRDRQAGEEGQVRGRDRAGRDAFRERRRGDRQDDLRGDGQGRQGRHDHGRGGEDARELP